MFTQFAKLFDVIHLEPVDLTFKRLYDLRQAVTVRVAFDDRNRFNSRRGERFERLQVLNQPGRIDLDFG